MVAAGRYGLALALSQPGTRAPILQSSDVFDESKMVQLRRPGGTVAR
jgi:hypothetical protein